MMNPRNLSHFRGVLANVLHSTSGMDNASLLVLLKHRSSLTLLEADMVGEFKLDYKMLSRSSLTSAPEVELQVLLLALALAVHKWLVNCL